MSSPSSPHSSLDNNDIPKEWGCPDHFFDECDEIFSVEEEEEIQRIVAQQRFQTAKAERKRAFEEDLKRQKEQFEDDEQDRDDHLFHTVAHEIWARGIQDVRNKNIPAYAFDYFPRLPLELQLRIWAMATEIEGVKCCTLIPHTGMLDEDEHEGRTRIDGTKIWDLRPKSERRMPSIYHVCQASRAVASSEYLFMNSKPWDFYQHPMPLCCNPSLTNFYIGGGGERTWKDYKIFIDILIQFNTTRPLPTSMKDDLDRFRRIQCLTIDFAVFAGAPTAIWSHFSNLELLNLTFYTADTIRDGSDSQYGPEMRPQFGRPQPGTKFGKRAKWIENTAASMLQKSPNEPARKFQIAALVRDVVNRGVPQCLENVLSEEQWRRDALGEENWTPPDDSQWYTQAENLLSTPALTKADISKMKHRFHPSRTVSLTDFAVLRMGRRHRTRGGTKQEDDAGPKERSLGQYYTDSEHESGTNKYDSMY